MSVELPVLKPKDFASDQDVRWCPGCGDYAILKQMQKILPDMGIARENIVFVSGIGCSSRFPYYMNTYGVHSIHGRAPAVATGLKATRPDLTVFVITGDGDGLSIGGNHLIHAIRRNVDMNIILFNNSIYGLTKGQYSPTSKQGHITKSTPKGSIDYPLSPLSVAIAAEATFIARSVDVHIKHLGATLKRAADHKGTSFVEVYQDCNVFNHGVWNYITENKFKNDNFVDLEHGKPMIFGQERNKGIRLNGWTPEVVDLNSVSEDELLVHNENADSSGLSFLLSRMRHPELPEPIGVFRAIERTTYDDALSAQIDNAKNDQGEGDINKLIGGGETWVVE